ncbi:MAG: hypothetical protein Q8P05_01435 [Candidatus Diapherotrites archaeon]|nr:hypothetical protein [Candidatus Diapherotrites archaeon]
MATRAIQKMSACVVCGKKATVENTFKLASCGTHAELGTQAPPCPDCETKMVVKMGTSRAFWSCPKYPLCFGTRNLLNPFEEVDQL